MATKKQSMYLSGISERVVKKLNKKSKEMGISRNVLVEKILEDVLSIRKDFDAKKWLKEF